MVCVDIKDLEPPPEGYGCRPLADTNDPERIKLKMSILAMPFIMTGNICIV